MLRDHATWVRWRRVDAQAHDDGGGTVNGEWGAISSFTHRPDLASVGQCSILAVPRMRLAPTPGALQRQLTHLTSGGFSDAGCAVDTRSILYVALLSNECSGGASVLSRPPALAGLAHGSRFDGCFSSHYHSPVRVG
jgi:hypothetical protein